MPDVSSFYVVVVESARLLRSIFEGLTKIGLSYFVLM